MTQVTILTGSAGAGKTRQLLDHYCRALRDARAKHSPGKTLWLAPTRRIQQSISQQIVRTCGIACFTPNVQTFDLFAEKILAADGKPATSISAVMKRLLLRRISESMLRRDELRHFLPIAGATGFLDIISNFISELKREEIWPEAFVAACRQRNSAFARRDLEIGLIYEQYQQHLADQNWYDNEGRFWLARSALGAGVRGEFANVETLVVDGFADFTQTQYEILGYMADWINHIYISLPAEGSMARTDLFSKPQAAIARIEEHVSNRAKFVRESKVVRGSLTLHNPPTEGLPVAEKRPLSTINTVPPSTQWSPAIRTIADFLFDNPRSILTTSDANGLEIIKATGQFGEWEAVARRIKALLSGKSNHGVFPSSGATSFSPVRPQEIVIGLRAIEEDGPRLRNYLHTAGLPVWCEAALPLTSSAIVRSILSVLQLELEDWPFERLLAVLDSNYFLPKWQELASGAAVRAVAACLRRLQLQSDREAMLRIMNRYVMDQDPELPKAKNSVRTLSRLALPLLTRLSRTLDRLRRTHTLSDWADVLASIGDELGWKPQAEADSLSLKEAREYDLLQRIVRTAAEADQKLAGDRNPPKLALDKFVSELRDLLSHETLKPEPEPGGSILILSVDQIRNLDIPHLFLIGLTENSFPMNRADDCLFSESERRDFNERGVALHHRSKRQSDEMLLFYSVVTRARQSLTLSYPAINSKGQPVFPSPYVTALMSLFDRKSLKSSAEGQLDPVPTLEKTLTQSDLRIVAMSEACAGRAELLRAVLNLEDLRKPTWNTLAACDVADHRFHQRGFTIYEGQLDVAQNLSSLRQRFGAHHQFSATELESYARCPFQFWLSNVLRIGAVENPEEGTDYAARGTLLHEVLARLLIEGTLGNPESLQQRFVELVELQLARQIPETELQRALIGIEGLILNEWADAFAIQQSEYDELVDAQLTQIQFLAPEIPFGQLPESSTDVTEAYPAIQFGHGAQAVNLRGRIDRVDVGTVAGHPAYVIIDYKTGQRPSQRNQDLISGRSIQLALYLLAVKRLGLVSKDAVPYQMGFWALREKGFKPGMGRAKFEPLDAALVDSLEILLDDLLPRLAEGIRSGRFVVENEDLHCTGRCPYRTVCRVNQLRPLAGELGKQSPAPIDPTADAATGLGMFSR